MNKFKYVLELQSVRVFKGELYTHRKQKSICLHLYTNMFHEDFSSIAKRNTDLLVVNLSVYVYSSDILWAQRTIQFTSLILGHSFTVSSPLVLYIRHCNSPVSWEKSLTKPPVHSHISSLHNSCPVPLLVCNPGTCHGHVYVSYWVSY